MHTHSVFLFSSRTQADTIFPYVELSYTPIKDPVALDPGDFHEPHTSFWKLAKLGHHQGYLEATQAIKPVVYAGYPDPPLAPDEHLMCFDFLYWVSALKPFEWEERYVSTPGVVALFIAKFLPILLAIALGGRSPHTCISRQR